ncbi:hypothetical protein XFEB_01295 [Xylella fastidiosa EB92.1]|nr:hypothetical protein XFEB_01295 [Xylella fastidiosa EB92.1]
MGLPMVLKRSMVSPIDHDLLLRYVRFFEWAFRNEFTSCSKCYFSDDKVGPCINHAALAPYARLLQWHMTLIQTSG